MKPESVDFELLDEHGVVALAELVELSGLSEVEIRELTEVGVLVPRTSDGDALRYTAQCVVVARTASRLRNDFELTTGGLALSLTLLDQMRALEARIRELEALLPRS